VATWGKPELSIDVLLGGSQPPNAFRRDCQISPRFANPAMCSAARNASAWIVIVG
jgi:hypothetical protein